MEFNGKSYPLEIVKIYPEVRSGRFEVDMRFTKGAPDGIKRGAVGTDSPATRHNPPKPPCCRWAVFSPIRAATGCMWWTNSGNRATKRNITLGRKNPEFYEVLEGLQTGEKVITSSYENFGDNEVLEF